LIIFIFIFISLLFFHHRWWLTSSSCASKVGQIKSSIWHFCRLKCFSQFLIGCSQLFMNESNLYRCHFSIQ
jgi:hypothetical protein